MAVATSVSVKGSEALEMLGFKKTRLEPSAVEINMGPMCFRENSTFVFSTVAVDETGQEWSAQGARGDELKQYGFNAQRMI